MRELVIGIDPGAKGFMCVYNGYSYNFAPLREHPNDKVINPNVVSILKEAQRYNSLVCIEAVHAMPGQGLSSTFSFGESVGYIKGIVAAYNIPMSTVPPQKWQKQMWDASDKVVVDNKVNTKLTSYNCARRLHPKFDYLRNERSKKYDDNKVDATLICDYAIRMNL